MWDIEVAAIQGVASFQGSRLEGVHCTSCGHSHGCVPTSQCTQLIRSCLVATLSLSRRGAASVRGAASGAASVRCLTGADSALSV